MHSSHFILMDLSMVKPGSAWEINQLRERGLLDKVVFICGQETADSVPQILAAYFEQPIQVHYYDAEGILANHTVFFEELARSINAEPQ